jgi:hypothetical protein
MPSGARTPPGPLTKEITALLREHIARKKWRQVAVAESANLPTSSFSDLINDLKPIDIEQLDRICWSVGYPIEELVRKAEENTKNRQTSKTWPAKRLSDPS